MVKEKEYQGVNIVFLFGAGFIDQATGFLEKIPMTSVHYRYSKLRRNGASFRRKLWFGYFQCGIVYKIVEGLKKLSLHLMLIAILV